MLQDWNSNILSLMRAPDGDVGTVLDVFSFMKERFDITAHFAMPEFDFLKSSVAEFLLRRNSSAEQLKEFLPKNVKLGLGAIAVLDEGLYDCHGLDRLLIGRKKSTLCVRLPLSAYNDWIDLELNRLLYKNKYRLFFASFDLALILYPPEVIERLLRIQDAVYQFNYKALADENTCKIIRKLLERNATVLFGTSLTTIDKLWHYDLPYYLDSAKTFFTGREQRMLFQPHSLSDL